MPPQLMATAETSLPSRGAWIEIKTSVSGTVEILGRSPHGERGLKFLGVIFLLILCGRSPHGERGLKSPCHGGPALV